MVDEMEEIYLPFAGPSSPSSSAPLVPQPLEARTGKLAKLKKGEVARLKTTAEVVSPDRDDLHVEFPSRARTVGGPCPGLPG